MRFKSILCVFATVLMVSACGNTNVSNDNEAADSESAQLEVSEANEEGSLEIAEEVVSIEVSDDELREFTALFNTAEYNGFLTESFSSPEEINWASVLEFGAGLSVEGISGEEISDYLEATDQKELYGDLFVIRKKDFEDYVAKHTGLSSIPTDALTWDYVDKHESYYKTHWAAYQSTYTCVSGEKNGDHYTLRLRVNSEDLPGSNAGKNYGKWADRVLTLTKTGENAMVESNAIQWDDYCDEEQSFEVELPQFDGPVRFITYSANPDESDITLVKDGKYLMDLYTSVYTDDGNGYLNKILAIGFLDLNCDGMKDIAIVGDSDYGKHVLLYEAVSTKYLFEYFADLDEKKMAELGAEFTIPSLKDTLLGGNSDGTFASYKELYAQLARVYHVAREGYKYDLIYADDDDIPELVIDVPGYGASLYAYENGKAHCLMNDWAYGAMGNAGYSYIPGTGVYYNGNADHAGAIYYESYMSKREEGELATDYWVKHINFNDLDGDGWPSEDELEASGDYVGSSEYYNETDKKMTEDEVKAVIDQYNSYEMKPITGVMEYEELLSALGK
ncbi:hypothetical protein [Butyrivibrio sp. XBB1001]|uniref:hypothetical protein n=1 Tax=Butyrivibrio sp. XBB1001 TaxID=1280682 RepID=UPI00041FB100|nr:hypothetical protein [Butyrivibrio sp. XBB1001]